MSKTTQLNITTPMINNITGKPELNLSSSLQAELGIKTNNDIEQYREQIPKLTIHDVLTVIFDVIPIANKSEFEIYSSILKDMRESKRDNRDTIDVDKEDLDRLKKIFEKPIATRPDFNSRIAFVMEVIEGGLTDIILQDTQTVPPPTTN